MRRRRSKEASPLLFRRHSSSHSYCTAYDYCIPYNFCVHIERFVPNGLLGDRYLKLLSMRVGVVDVKFMQCDHTAAKVGSRLDLAPATFPGGLEARGRQGYCQAGQSQLPLKINWHRGHKSTTVVHNLRGA